MSVTMNPTSTPASSRSSGMTHSVRSTNLADILERVLDKGIVIAGDITVKLVDVELLTAQIRLVVCSVDRALELGLDWWSREPAFQGSGAARDELAGGAAASSEAALPAAGWQAIEARLASIEERLAQ